MQLQKVIKVTRTLPTMDEQQMYETYVGEWTLNAINAHWGHISPGGDLEILVRNERTGQYLNCDQWTDESNWEVVGYMPDPGIFNTEDRLVAYLLRLQGAVRYDPWLHEPRHAAYRQQLAGLRR